MKTKIYLFNKKNRNITDYIENQSDKLIKSSLLGANLSLCGEQSYIITPASYLKKQNGAKHEGPNMCEAGQEKKTESFFYNNNRPLSVSPPRYFGAVRPCNMNENYSVTKNKNDNYDSDPRLTKGGVLQNSLGTVYIFIPYYSNKSIAPLI